jgi:RHS repeat-associated protein
VITDSNGAVVSRRDFKPFGEELVDNIGNRLGDSAASNSNFTYGANDGIRQKFTGYQKDTETGLDFAEARMYENRHARFTAVDPLLASGKSANPQTFNRYVYVMNSPMALTDPDGLQSGKWHYPVDSTGAVIDGGKYRYILNGQSTDGYREVTRTNRRGFLIGDSPAAPEGYVVVFNPFGPASVNNPFDLDDLLFNGSFVRNGWDVIMSDETYESFMRTGAVFNAIEPVDVALALGPLRAIRTVAAAEVAPGVVSGSLAGLTQAERSFVAEMISQGRNVRIIERAASKTADFVIDGLETELKTLTSAGPNTLKNAIQTATKQGRNIVIDARNVEITAENAMGQILRVEGNGYAVKGRVTVYTSNGTVTY